MDPLKLFACELAGIAIFNFCLLFSHSLVQHIESKHLFRHRTSEYLLYSRDRCSCLFMICFSELILLCICLTAVNAKVNIDCHQTDFEGDCATHRIIWKVFLVGSYIMFGVILLYLLVSIPRIRLRVAMLRRRFYFQSWVLGFAHVLLQISALFVVVSLSSDKLFQNGPNRISNQESTAVALISIIAFEMGFIVWVFGTIVFVLELFVTAYRQLMESQGVASRPAVLRRMLYVAMPLTDG